MNALPWIVLGLLRIMGLERWMCRVSSNGRAGHDVGCEFNASKKDPESELACELLHDYVSGAESAKRTAKIARMVCKVRNKSWKQDLLKMISKTGNSKRNVCRNLHSLLRRNKALFPVDVDVAPVTVAVRRPVYRTEAVWWPVLPMSAWVKALWNEAPSMLLGGHSNEDVAGWQSILSNFWKQYRSFNDKHPIYADGHDQRFCIPFFLHGDEGRGQCRRPFMVESWQPCISFKGTDFTNESGHSMTTRFFLTCISSYYFHKDVTLDGLHDFIADDAASLYHNGLEVSPRIKIRLVCVGTKGDWVFLRKAFHLNCGFNCSAKCHLCNSTDWHNLGENASWRGTCGDQRQGSPFKHGHRNPLLRIPGMNKDSILPDSLHCFHLGWGQDLAASAVVLLCKLGHFQGRCLNSRLATAYAEFTAWVGRSKKTTGIDWWSKLKLDMASDNDWPTSLGSSNGKACDTALVLGWLEEFLGTIECARNDLLQGLKVAVVSSNAFFRNMRACGLWVTEPHRAVVLAAAKSMCEAYGYLASKCFTMRMKLFRLRPKIHFQQHITMLLNLGDVGFSALNFSCWSDEDYIGRVSRLSRTCHPRTMALRCLEKALTLVLYSIQFKKFR